MTQPDFWSRPPGFWSRLLSPASAIFSAIGRVHTLVSAPDKIEVPIVCVGNVNVGGAGKTPTAIALANRLKQNELNVHFLTRGYLGRLQGPLRVDLGHHDASDVGDEPMLLAAHAPTWIAKNRAAGAIEAVSAGAQIIVMDDGFQNPHLHKDLAIVVIDGESGFGNGLVMPSGPLREPVPRALARADMVVIIGGSSKLRPDIEEALADYDHPVMRARLDPPPNIEKLKREPVFAFAGIGRPAKFFDMLTAHGLNVIGTKAFPDHHDFTAEDMMALLEAAGTARLVTTAKDFARLDDDGRVHCTVIPVNLVFEQPDMLDVVLGPLIPDQFKAAPQQDP